MGRLFEALIHEGTRRLLDSYVRHDVRDVLGVAALLYFVGAWARYRVLRITSPDLALPPEPESEPEDDGSFPSLKRKLSDRW